MKLREMVPLPHERGFIVGTTGSGKTTLALKMLRHYKSVVAIDPKGTLGAGGIRGGSHLRGYELARSPRELENVSRQHKLIQYRPEMGWQTPGHWERVYDYIYRRGNAMVYNDELADVHHWNRAPMSLRRIITSGRELGIGHLGATQRPKQIERRIMSEAERWYVFHLRDLDDLRFLRSRVGKGRLPAYGFWYSRDVEPFTPPLVRRIRL